MTAFQHPRYARVTAFKKSRPMVSLRGRSYAIVNRPETPRVDFIGGQRGLEFGPVPRLPEARALFRPEANGPLENLKSLPPSFNQLRGITRSH
jgi:hypothetical protein